MRDDQLSLAIGKRGQNVRLAARLTGWDVDILTPDEYTKGMETMYATVTSIAGVTEAQADKLAALGMVSVFDVEEVGVETLMSELGIDEQTASTMVETASARAKEVAVEQQKAKEEKERLAREEHDAAARLLADGDAPSSDEQNGSSDNGSNDAGEAGEAAADRILGG